MAGRVAPHILLMGLRGSGKSTIGRVLARRTRRRFVDLDDETPRLLRRESVAEVFEHNGEAAFREAECGALRRALAGPASVIALGGGTPTAPDAAESMVEASAEGRAACVYLRADAATLRARLAGADNAHRPSLTGEGVLEEIERVLCERDELYRALADAVVTTDRLTAEETLELLLAIDERGVGAT